MSYKVIPTLKFEKEIKRLSKKYPSLKNEFGTLIKTLSSNPDTGNSIGNSCYKIRLSLASKGKGKRGGARVITHFYVAKEIVYLLSIYDKSEKSDLKPNELKILVESLELD